MCFVVRVSHVEQHFLMYFIAPNRGQGQTETAQPRTRSTDSLLLYYRGIEAKVME
jgi:hypothetical protein